MDKTRRDSLQLRPNTAREDSDDGDDVIAKVFHARQRSRSLPVAVEQTVALALRSISDKFDDDLFPMKDKRKRRSLPPDVSRKLRSYFEDHDDDEGIEVGCLDCDDCGCSGSGGGGCNGTGGSSVDPV